MELIGYVAAVLMGVSLGLIGGGGSILTVPILVYFFKQDPLIATTESLFIVGSTALAGGAAFARSGFIEFRSGFFFAVPSILGVYFSRHFLLPALPDRIASAGAFTLTKSSLVLLSFIALMILASFAMIRGSKPGRATEGASAASASPFRVATRGFFVGVVTGFVGAGGGFLIIPALVILLGLPMRSAVGTSLGIIALNSLFGFSISLGHRPVDWPLVLLISGLGIWGLLIGHRLSPKVDERSLKRGFGYFVLIIGLILFIDQVSDLAR